MLLWQAVDARADPLEDCEQAQDVDRRIHGCTYRIHQFPRDATAFFNRGSAHMSKGELDRAIADYTGVIQIDPAYSPAYYRRGIAYELARAAVDHARSHGARALEAYPILTEKVTTDEIHVGTPSIFAAAGLSRVSHPTLRRVVMRIDFPR